MKDEADVIRLLYLDRCSTEVLLALADRVLDELDTRGVYPRTCLDDMTEEEKGAWTRWKRKVRNSNGSL